MSLDVITRLYFCAESLGMLSRLMPEQEGGLAHLLLLLSRDLAKCVAELDEKLPLK